MKLISRLVCNIAGLAMLLAGVFLSLPFIPGPGVPLIFLGLALVDWPGKTRFFNWMRRFPWFNTTANWLEKNWKFRLPGTIPGVTTVTQSPKHSSPGDDGSESPPPPEGSTIPPSTLVRESESFPSSPP